VDEIKKEPLVLPGGYEWVTLDITKSDQLEEMYELLKEHYVEDDENMFRFNYSADFLRWALTPPHYYADWHIGVRKTKTGGLVACITGVPAHMMLYDSKVLLCEINFLCVHKTLRSKRLAPVLIKEVTRRVNLRGMKLLGYQDAVPVSATHFTLQGYGKQLTLLESFYRNRFPRVSTGTEASTQRSSSMSGFQDWLRV
jgi:glycylpeptide N-tetradecanoyltransferase